MSKYYFEAIDSLGSSTSGSIEAESIAAASKALEDKGLHLITIRLDDVVEQNKLEEEAGRRQAFKSKIAHSLEQRHGWLPAFKALHQDMPAGRAKTATKQLLNTLESELTADALLSHKHASAILPLLTAQEKSTFEASRLIEWLSALQLIQFQRSRRIQAFAYPAVLLGLALAVLALMAVFIIPIFKEIFIEFGINLPAPTRFVIYLSDIATSREGVFALLATLLVLASVMGGVFFWRKKALTNRLLRGFVAGTATNLYAMSTLCGTLGELLRFGAPVSDALEIAGLHSRHHYFELSAQRLGRDIANGIQINDSKASRQLPPLVIYAIELATQQRPGIRLLKQLQAMYRERAISRLDWLNAMLPAVTMIVLGIVVGFVTVSLFLPLVSLVSSLA